MHDGGVGCWSLGADPLEKDSDCMPGHSGRQRGLFPLPFIEDISVLDRRLSRGVRQRLGIRRKLAQRTNEMIEALNSLYGVGGFAAPVRSSPAQSVSVGYLAKVAKEFDLVATRPRAQEALSELLRSSAVYRDGSTTAPYRESLLSLPGFVGGAPLVSTLVRPEDQEYLMGIQREGLVERRGVLERFGDGG